MDSNEIFQRKRRRLEEIKRLRKEVVDRLGKENDNTTQMIVDDNDQNVVLENTKIVNLCQLVRSLVEQKEIEKKTNNEKIVVNDEIINVTNEEITNNNYKVENEKELRVPIIYEKCIQTNSTDDDINILFQDKDRDEGINIETNTNTTERNENSEIIDSQKISEKETNENILKEKHKELSILSENASENRLSALVSSFQFEKFIDQSVKIIERTIDEYDIVRNYKSNRNSHDNSLNDSTYKLLPLLQFHECPILKSRPLLSMDWFQTDKELIATGYGNTDSQLSYVTGAAALWNIHSVMSPEIVFEATSPITVVKKVPGHASLVIGGGYHGQVYMWDARTGPLPIQRTRFSSNVQYDTIVALDVNELIAISSLSTDGIVLNWAPMMLSLSATETLRLGDKLAHPGLPLGINCGIFDSTMTGSLTAGLDDGRIISGNLVDESDVGSNYNLIESFSKYKNATTTTITNGVNNVNNTNNTGIIQTGQYDNGPAFQLGKHEGPVIAMCNSDSSPLVATASMDWSLKLWNKATNKCCHTLELDIPLVDISWCPKSTATLAILDGSARLGIFSIVCDRDDQLVCETISDIKGAPNRVLWSPEGDMLAIGTTEGGLSIIRPSDNLCTNIKECEQKNGQLVKDRILSQGQIFDPKSPPQETMELNIFPNYSNKLRRGGSSSGLLMQNRNSPLMGSIKGPIIPISPSIQSLFAK